MKRKLVEREDVDTATTIYLDKLEAIEREIRRLKIIEQDSSRDDQYQTRREIVELDTVRRGLEQLQPLVTKFGFDVDALPEGFTGDEEQLAALRAKAYNEAREAADIRDAERQRVVDELYLKNMQKLGYSGVDEDDDFTVESEEAQIRKDMYQAEEEYRQSHFGRSPKETDRGLGWYQRGGGTHKAKLQNARRMAMSYARQGVEIEVKEDE